MSRTTSTTSTTPANDVSTVAGFLAEYDQRIEALIREQAWCSDAYAYAYPGDKLIRPRDRHPALTIPQEWLSDEGKAEVAKLNSGTLAELQQAVLSVAARANRRGYVLMSTVNEIFTALGMAEVPSESHHNGSFYVQGNFTTPKQLTRDERNALQEAAKAAVLATFDGKLTIADEGTYSEFNSDRSANTVAQWPTE